MTNKQNRALLFTAILAVPVLSVAAIILRAAALFSVFDGKDYFLPGAALPDAFLILSLAAVLVFILFAILSRKKITLPAREGKTRLSLLFSSAFLSVTLATIVFVSVLSAMAATGPYIPLFHILNAVFALLSILYLSYYLRELATVRTPLHTYLSLAPCLLSLSVAILLYFDQSTQMNQPAKLLSLAAFLLLACVFLVECRMLLASSVGALRYLTLGVGFFLTVTASLPNLIYTLVRGKELVLSCAYDFLLFAFSLYLLSSLLELLPERERKVHCMVSDLTNENEESAPEGETEADAEAENATEAPVTEASSETDPKTDKKENE